MQRRKSGTLAVRCDRCRRPTVDPKRGLCSRCYQDDYHGRSSASACEACGQGDVRVLVRRRLRGERCTLCANCAAILGRRPMTLGELAAEVRPAGDRRQADRRQADRRHVDRRRSDAYGGAGGAVELEQRAESRGRRASDRAA